MNTRTKFIALAALACSSLCAYAGDNGTVYTQLGINGLGIGYAKSVNENWSLRGQYNYFPSQSFTGNSGDYGPASTTSANLTWNSLELLADWYFTQGFHLTVGAVSINSSLAVDAANATIGSSTGQNAHASIKLNSSVAPYLGIGYLSKPKDAHGLGFNFDLGVMSLNPTASLTSSASASDTAAQQAKVQNAINSLQTFPVIAIGVGYSF